MRSKFFLAASLLLLLSSPLLCAEEKYVLTAAEYDQIIQSLMTAQKSLREADAQLAEQDSQLKALSQKLKEQSEYYRAQSVKATKDKIVIGGVAFCVGMAGAAVTLYLLSAK